MGKMINVAAELAKDNPGASSVSLMIYAHALQTYCEASQNVVKNGAICTHPRTGAPIENPYLRIQAQQAGILSKMGRIKSDRVQRMIQKSAAAKEIQDAAGVATPGKQRDAQ